MFTYTIVAGALLATLGADTPGATPRAADGSWAAWHGCWAAEPDGTTGHLVCVLPGRDAAEARMVTIGDNAVQGSIVVRADGAPRPVQEGGCSGSEVAQWSRDGRRVFMRAELECDGLHRVSTGVLSMVAEDSWIDIQAATVSGQHATRSIRYYAVPSSLAPEEIRAQLDETRTLARQAARLRASAPLHVEDVIEAASQLAEPALQGMIAAHSLAFRADARSLVRLEEAGVPGSGIDMVVAVGHPNRFVIRETEQAPVLQTVARSSGSTLRCYDPVLDVYFYGDDCYQSGLARGPFARYGYYGYGWGYGYGYSPWGYDRYGWRFGGYPVVIVRPGGEGRGSSELVKGSGYSRGNAPSRGTAQPRSGGDGGAQPRSGGDGGSQPRNTGTVNSGSRNDGSSRTAVPRGESSSGSTTTSTPSTSTSSGSSSSSGSDSSGSSRTAVPRPDNE